MKVLWICGLPEEVRSKFDLTDVPAHAMGWIMGHLPPPPDVELHILCPVYGLKKNLRHSSSCTYKGAVWHPIRLRRFEPAFLRLRFAWSIRKLVRQINPDVIHGWGGELGPGLIATYLSKRAVVSIQGLLRMLNNSTRSIRSPRPIKKEFGPLKLFLEWLCYRRAGRLLCESETAKRELLNLYGFEGEVVWHPLRPEFLNSRVEHKEHKEFKFLFVGQDVPRKGIGDARRAFSICSTRSPRLKLEIVTSGKSAAELVELMQSADCLVMPSYGDTGPTVVKEAISQGLWPIVYSGSGAEELVRRYNFGTIVPCGDIPALAQAMHDFVQNSTSIIRNSKIRKFENSIRSDLSPNAIWPQLLQIYSEVLHG